MAKFKKNYDTGEVTLPGGCVVKVMDLPIESLVAVAVDGFILRCQDHCGSVKELRERKKDEILSRATKLISGAFAREREDAKRARENKLEKLDWLEARLEDFSSLSDEEKRTAAKFGISRGRKEAVRLLKILDAE